MCPSDLASFWKLAPQDFITICLNGTFGLGLSRFFGLMGEADGTAGPSQCYSASACDHTNGVPIEAGYASIVMKTATLCEGPLKHALPAPASIGTLNTGFLRKLGFR